MAKTCEQELAVKRKVKLEADVSNQWDANQVVRGRPVLFKGQGSGKV